MDAKQLRRAARHIDDAAKLVDRIWAKMADAGIDRLPFAEDFGRLEASLDLALCYMPEKEKT